MTQVALNTGDPGEIALFKSLYEQAKIEGRQQFLFKGQPVLVDYAKYLIEYIDQPKTMNQKYSKDK